MSLRLYTSNWLKNQRQNKNNFFHIGKAFSFLCTDNRKIAFLDIINRLYIKTKICVKNKAWFSEQPVNKLALDPHNHDTNGEKIVQSYNSIITGFSIFKT